MMRSMDSRTYVDNDHAAALDTTPQLQQGQAATQDDPAVALPHSAATLLPTEPVRGTEARDARRHDHERRPRWNGSGCTA